MRTRISLILIMLPLISACGSHSDSAKLASIQPPHYTEADLNWPKAPIVRYLCRMASDGIDGRLVSEGAPDAPGLLPGFMLIRKKHAMPPYYKGESPLTYVLGETPGRGYVYGNPTPLFYEFATFTTEFLISEGDIVAGARTVSKDGKLKAVATVNYFIKDLPGGTKGQGIEIQEYHFNDAERLVFTCKSNIDPHTGFKTSESDTAGRKQNEYYFIWPVSE